MVSFVEAVQEQSRVILCNLLGGPESVPYLGGSVSDDANNLQRAINGARRYICNDADPIPSGELPQPEFTGGQCPFNYNGVLRITVVTGSGDFSFNTNFFNILGPISGAYFELVPGQNSVRYGVVNDTGNVFVGATSANGFQGVSVLSVTPSDGGSDNCGDPPPQPPPDYIPEAVTVNIEYEDNSQTIINEDVDITFFSPVFVAPPVFFAPITITGNDFALVGQLDLTGEFDISLFPDASIQVGGVTEVLPPGPDPSVPEPDVDKTRVILGAIVTVTSVPGEFSETKIFQGDNPDIFIPRLGSVSFLIATQDAIAWTADIDVKNLRQFVPCPYLGGAVGVFGTPAPGWEFAVSPVFAPTILPELPGS